MTDRMLSATDTDKEPMMGKYADLTNRVHADLSTHG